MIRARYPVLDEASDSMAGGAAAVAPVPELRPQDETTKPKPRRGRPPNPDGPKRRDYAAERKRRAERTGSPERTQKSERQGPGLTRDRLAGYLEAGHAIAAKLARAPALEIDTSEARDLSGAVLDVLKHHKIELSEKWLAYANLIGVGLTIYTPRVLVIMAARSLANEAEPAEPAEPASAQVAPVEPAPAEPAAPVDNAGQRALPRRARVKGGKIKL